MPNGVGSWDPPLEKVLGIVGVHAVVLYTGRVLYWCFDQRAVGQINSGTDAFRTYFPDPNLGSYQIWDPTSETAGEVGAIGRNSFCAGQCTLPDGTVFVAGGQDQYGAMEQATTAQDVIANWFASVVGGSNEGAQKDIHTYDPAADVWMRWPEMPEGRYYPTCLILDDGTAFVASGLSNLQRWVFSGANWCKTDTFEIRTAGKLLFRQPPQKFMPADQYAIIRLLPGCRHLFVHIDTASYLFDLDAASFIPGAEFMPPGVGMQTYPMQTGHVLLPQKEGDAPRILIVGGSTATGFDYDTHSDAPAVQDAFIFEYNAASPTDSHWRSTKGKPNSARLLSDTVLLPDGTVFVVNGISVGAAAGHSGPTVGTAEIFDPVAETFTLASPPSAAHPRAYHATAILLPDARVAIAGNTAAYNPGEIPAPVDDQSIEIYYPPYLNSGPRPATPANLPSSVDYGSTLTIPNAATPVIDAVMMMRPCAVTHSVDMDQRAVQLVVTPANGRANLNISIPSDRSLAPPGPYMFFFLARGIPSVATFIFVGVPAPPSGGDSVPPPDCAAGGPYSAVNLGTYEGNGTLNETKDGDVTIDKISDGFTLQLKSLHGSITINYKIDQHSFVNLTACGSVSIGEKIDQHSQATISARGNIRIGQKIDQGSSGILTSVAGSINIGQKIDQHSSAKIRAGTTVHIGQKIDQHSDVTIVAQGDINIDQGLDQHSNSDITSLNGSITIGQAVDGGATATLRAPNGSITIGQKVAGGAQVRWHALSFNCPDTSGGTVTQF
jgi:Domain of unknown function (DUF1929)